MTNTSTKLASTIIGIALVAGACTSSNENPTEPTEGTQAEAVSLTESANFTEGECEMDMPRRVVASCGWLTVPTDWDTPEDLDSTARLHVAVLVEDDTPVDATPVVYLDGGPGGATIADLGLAYGQLFGDLVEDRPVVVYSQRGSKFSTPDLECEEINELNLELIGKDVPDDALSEQALNVAGDCAERLESEGIDFAEVNSANAANDLDALRVALGYDQWNIYSLSYGTHLAQSYARLFPDSIEALVLDSVQPTQPDLAAGRIAKNAERSFNLLFESCAADEECSQNYPNLEQRFFDLYEELEETPVKFQAISLDTLTLNDVVWDGDSFVLASFSALYEQEVFSTIPAMVAEMENGQYISAGLLASLEIFSIPRIAVGMNTTVLCHDAYRHFEKETFLSAEASNPVYNKVFGTSEKGFDELQTLCGLYGDSKADQSDIELVDSEVPTLITAGTFDPITPPSNGQAVAEGFSNSTYLEFPTLGHGVIGTECGTDIIRSFFTNSEADVDSGCIAELPDIDWQ